MTFDKIEIDLATLAGIAAIELDNLILRRAKSLEKVERLLSKIREMVPIFGVIKNENEVSISHLDPRAVVMLNRAIIESKNGTEHDRMYDVITQIARILDRLEQIVRYQSQGKKQDQRELKKMRFFCLTLSKIAAIQKGIRWLTGKR